MDITPLPVIGAFVVTPRQFGDDRGRFLESFRGDLLAEHTGHRLDVVQTNVSVSARGVLRGIHFTDVPPGQAKYVTALAGAFLDFLVDLRLGSPTYGVSEAVRIDAVDRRAVYVPEGVGHGLLSLQDGSTAMYLCNATYDPTRDREVHPLDPEIGLQIPADLGAPQLSPKDAAAPTLAQARARGLLPMWKNYEMLRGGTPSV